MTAHTLGLVAIGWALLAVTVAAAWCIACEFWGGPR